MGSLSSDRQQEQCAEPGVTQPEPAPKRDTQIDTEQDVAEERVLAEPDVRCNRPVLRPRIKCGDRKQHQTDRPPESVPSN